MLRHLLYAIDEDTGKFANLAGNLVEVENGFIRISSRQDSRRSKRVRLMFTEEMDLSDEHPNVGIVRIMHIDRPLIGGPRVSSILSTTHIGRDLTKAVGGMYGSGHGQRADQRIFESASLHAGAWDDLCTVAEFYLESERSAAYGG